MSSAIDFVIENGVLTKYVGPGGDVMIPEGVTSIGTSAFSGLCQLNRVRIPESVTRAAPRAFSLWIPVYSRSLILDIKRWIPGLSRAVEGCRLTAIYTEDRRHVPSMYRGAVAVGTALKQNADLSTAEAAADMAYLSRRAAKLCSDAFDQPALLDFLCRHKLLKAKDMDVYLQEAQKRGLLELKIRLLDYANASGERLQPRGRQRTSPLRQE